MIILGLDPGTATTGYGVVKYLRGRLTGICYGTITTPAEDPMSKRLLTIYEELGQVIDRFRPDEIAIEKLFFGRNTTTAITVGQARGILLLQAEMHHLPVGEYTPMQVKRAIVGYGMAEKKQMQRMVREILKLDYIPKPDDAADALGIAICHAHMRGAG